MRARTALATAAVLLAGATAPAATTQHSTSRTCEFALLAFVSLSMDVVAARRAYAQCLQVQGRHCEESGRKMQRLQQQANIAENYIHRYCRR